MAQQLSNTAIDTLILWLTVHWRPKAVFSWQRLKGLLSYGWRLLASSLLDTVYNNLRSLVIGRVYTSADLAFYNEGMLAPDTIAVNVDSSIDSVLLPAMSAVQDEPARVKNMTRRAIKTCVYVIAPLMMAMLTGWRNWFISISWKKIELCRNDSTKGKTNERNRWIY